MFVAKETRHKQDPTYQYSRERYTRQATQPTRRRQRVATSGKLPSYARKRRSPLLPILVGIAVCVIAFVVFFFSPFGQYFFGLNNDPDNAEVDALSLGGFGQSFSLLGDRTETIMARSHYTDPGTSGNSGDVVIDGTVNTEQAGTYTISYTNGSETLTRVVNVIDDKQMVMNLKGSAITYVKQGQPYLESGCHVIDKVEGDLTGKVATTGAVDTATPGEYEILYSVANSSGVKCTKLRTVRVIPQAEFVATTVGVPVLMYHYVYTAQDEPITDPYVNNYIKDTVLDEHLTYLTANNYYFPSFVELNAYANGTIDLPAKSIVLTFDDGEAGFLNHGIPLFEKHKIPATSFIIASDSDAGDKVRNYASEYISFQSHSYAMHQAGGNTGHGGRISAMTQSEIVDDLTEAQNIVQNTEALAYPFGDNTPTAHAAVREAGILCSFTTKNGFVHVGDDIAQLSRVRINGNISIDAFVGAIS